MAVSARIITSIEDNVLLVPSSSVKTSNGVSTVEVLKDGKLVNKNVEIGNAWRNVSYGQDKQNDLLSVSSQFGVAVGLAERTE
jgi:multidrug efflux pump subunit AcrA (membrane-fusion protein)